MVALPNVADNRQFAQLNAFRHGLTHAAWALLSLSFAVGALQYWAAGFAEQSRAGVGQHPTSTTQRGPPIAFGARAAAARCATSSAPQRCSRATVEGRAAVAQLSITAVFSDTLVVVSAPNVFAAACWLGT